MPESAVHRYLKRREAVLGRAHGDGDVPEFRRQIAELIAFNEEWDIFDLLRIIDGNFAALDARVAELEQRGDAGG